MQSNLIVVRANTGTRVVSAVGIVQHMSVCFTRHIGSQLGISNGPFRMGFRRSRAKTSKWHAISSKIAPIRPFLAISEFIQSNSYAPFSLSDLIGPAWKRVIPIKRRSQATGRRAVYFRRQGRFPVWKIPARRKLPKQAPWPRDRRRQLSDTIGAP